MRSVLRRGQETLLKRRFARLVKTKPFFSFKAPLKNSFSYNTFAFFAKHSIEYQLHGWTKKDIYRKTPIERHPFSRHVQGKTKAKLFKISELRTDRHAALLEILWYINENYIFALI